MARYRRYEPQQTVMVCLDPRVMFPVGSFERFLVDTIGQIDIDVFDEGEEDVGGETPYDPRSILGILFYGFSKGVFSSRRLAAACARDVGFMYVAGHAEPTHSTICRFVIRHRRALKSVCAQLLYIAEEAGFLDCGMVAIDGTKIKGNASKQFSGTLADFEKRRDRLERSIEQAIGKQQAAEEAEEKVYWEKKEQRYRKNHQRIAQFLTQARPKLREDGKERRQNMTDTDCRIMKSRGVYVCGYNAQLGVDVESGLILVADIIDEGNDAHAFSFVAEQMQSELPAQTRTRVKASTYVADNGYYCGDSLAYADEHELDVYIADGTSQSLYQDAKTVGSKGRRIGAKDCTIELDEEGQPLLTCPGGIRTGVYSRKQLARRQVYRFRVGYNRSECVECRWRERCVGKKKINSKEFEVDVQMLEHHEFIERHREKLHSSEGKRIYSKRMSSIEPRFGEVKENRGFRSFLRRGLEKVGTEWRIVAMSCNLKRMWRLASREESTEKA